jgi:hypothetical protein
MNEPQIEEQFHLVQQELTLTGEAVETLKRDSRAEIDALRLEVEVLQRCLRHLHPDAQGQIDRIREEVVQEVNPEAT